MILLDIPNANFVTNKSIVVVNPPHLVKIC